MQRLVIRAIEEFLRDTYGDEVWAQMCRFASRGARGGCHAPLGPAENYLRRAERMIPVAARLLGKPADELFEDLGAWLARREPIRRLLRFSGRDFNDFVLSLAELPGRAHFVIPDLDVPPIEVIAESASTVRLSLPPPETGWTAVIGGLLRAMADDYGALGLIAVEGHKIMIHISDEAFAEAREFQIGGGQSPRRAG